MNALSPNDIGILRRQVKGAVLDDLRALIDPPADHRPAGLVARLAAVHLLAKAERCQPAEFARQHFARDTDLHHLIRTASGPAMTTGSGWAAELAAVTVADIATNLLPASVLSQLRAASGQPYAFVAGSTVKVPIHSPIASGGFVAEGDPIKVGALILTALGLKPKKAASITAVTKELIAGSPINVEIGLRTLLSQDLGLAVDNVLLSNAAATTAAPAGLRRKDIVLRIALGEGSGEPTRVAVRLIM